MLNQEALQKIIRAKAAEHGFIVEETNWGICGISIREVGDRENSRNSESTSHQAGSSFSYIITRNCDWEERKVILHISGSVSTMGADHKEEDLHMMKETVRQADDLAKALGEQNLYYTAN